MSETTKRFAIEVPENSEPHAEPIIPGRRFKQGDVVLNQGTEDDLLDMAKAFQEEFPATWWDPREPLETRPEPETRLRRCAERLRPLVDFPGLYTVIARDAHTGVLLGYGTWFEPGVESFLPLRRDAVEHLKLKDRFNWSDEYVKELWSSMNTDLWDSRFIEFDNDRKRIMGDEPHWYLAPLLTVKEHRGRGVAGLVMKYAIEKAENSSPPRPLYLEASPVGKPMYMHYGFRMIPTTETAMVRYPIGDPRRPDDA